MVKQIKQAVEVALEKLRGMIEVVNQKVDDYIKKNDSKIEDAHTVANILLGKYEDMKQENAALKEWARCELAKLDDKVSAATTLARDSTSNTIAAAAQISEAKSFIKDMRDAQQKFLNSFFAKLILAFGAQVVILLLGVIVSIHFAKG